MLRAEPASTSNISGTTSSARDSISTPSSWTSHSSEPAYGCTLLRWIHSRLTRDSMPLSVFLLTRLLTRSRCSALVRWLAT